MKFQLSPNDVDYYYWDGGLWTIATEESLHKNSASELKSNIVSYSNLTGPSYLYVKVFLSTNIDQTEACSISDIDVDVSTD